VDRTDPEWNQDRPDGQSTDDPEYLKNYVKVHPNNKMAWYLLGREYAARGEAGKANYCFAQAGEVYEAFEAVKAPGRLEWGGAAEEASGRAVPADEARRRAATKKAVLAALFAAIALSFSDDAARQADVAPPAVAADFSFSPDRSPHVFPDIPEKRISAALPGELTGTGPLSDTAVYYANMADAGGLPAELLGNVLAPLVSSPEPRPAFTLLARAMWSADGRWMGWLKPVQPLVSAERTAGSSVLKVSYHDAGACSCEPADPSDALSKYVSWQRVQEERLIVRSAVAGYKRLNGRLPEAPEQLVADYPNNVLPGLTPAMLAFWDEAVADSAAYGDAERHAAAGESVGAETKAVLPAEQLLQQPLSIIVDKAVYRLAVVSGNVVLRNYPVGLGGARTPEGEFTITEKVRNPNGRDDGEFGSRGMTLSDSLYAIHGTNRPDSIGKDESQGCIRMLKADIEELFDMVPKGTKVTIGERLLPTDVLRAENPLSLPPSANETNPNRTYRWLG
jgi:hypothetical protein